MSCEYFYEFNDYCISSMLILLGKNNSYFSVQTCRKTEKSYYIFTLDIECKNNSPGEDGMLRNEKVREYPLCTA